MRFFLAVLTVAAIGLALAGFALTAPLCAIMTAIWAYWKAGNYKKNLEKEYEEYKERRREEFRNSLGYNPRPYNIKVPTWFDQEKYGTLVLNNEEKNVTIDGFDELYTVDYKYFVTAFYEIPSNPESACYTVGKILNKDLCNLIEKFGIRLAKLYKSNPNDSELKKYMQKVHDLDFDSEWVYLEDPRYKSDILKCKYLTLEEFKTMSSPKTPQQTIDNIIGGTIILIAGIVCFIFLTIPFLSSIGS